MKLLIFAYFSEAKLFISHFKLEQDPNFNSLYLGENLSLLIAGEGAKNAVFSVTKLIDLKKSKWEFMINLGVCGSLNDQLQIGDALTISSVLGENSIESISTGERGVSCITAKERVEGQTYKNLLRPFADTCDREAWFIATLAKKYGIKFRCYKVVSDFSNDNNLAQIKANMKFLGQKLLEYYLSESSKCGSLLLN